MLADLPLPPLDIPKSDYCGDYTVRRSRLSLHSDVYQDISRIVTASLSPIQSESPTLDGSRLSSPTSPPPLDYVSRLLDSPPAVYEPEQSSLHYSYESARIHPPHNYSQTPVESEQLSDSSPVDVHPSTFHQPLPSDSNLYPSHILDRRLGPTRYPSLPGNSSFPVQLLDQRRMSEPTVHYPLSTMNTGGFSYDESSSDHLHDAAPRSAGYQQRESSLRDLRHQYHPLDHSGAQSDSGWRQAEEAQGVYRSSLASDEPVSPYHSSFTGGPLHGSPSEHMPPWPSGSQHDSPPPGTGQPPASPDSDSKRYSFVALPGNAVKKRPRRRYDEIERLYQCSWPDCNKAYGTLNHLNAHVTMQKHGPKRNPNEFKELRKQWRKAKKESEFSPGLHLGGEHDMYGSRFSSRTHPYSYPSPMPPTGGASHIGSELPYPDNRIQGHRVGERNSYDERERFPPSSNTWSPGSFGRSSATYSTVPFPPLSSIVPPQHSLHTVPPERNDFHRELSPRLGGTGHRLPANSTLLTPLPGYQASATLPPLDPRVDMEYSSEAYYDSARGRRSDPGYMPSGCSDDEYR